MSLPPMARGRIAHCTICGAEDRLIRSCPRCYKYACEKQDCIEVILDISMCKVPKQLLAEKAEQFFTI